MNTLSTRVREFAAILTERRAKTFPAGSPRPQRTHCPASSPTSTDWTRTAMPRRGPDPAPQQRTHRRREHEDQAAQATDLRQSQLQPATQENSSHQLIAPGRRTPCLITQSWTEPLVNSPRRGARTALGPMSTSKSTCSSCARRRPTSTTPRRSSLHRKPRAASPGSDSPTGLSLHSRTKPSANPTGISIFDSRSWSPPAVLGHAAPLHLSGVVSSPTVYSIRQSRERARGSRRSSSRTTRAARRPAAPVGRPGPVLRSDAGQVAPWSGLGRQPRGRDRCTGAGPGAD